MSIDQTYICIQHTTNWLLSNSNKCLTLSTALNGYMYGNLKGLNMCKGDKVSWHLSGLGSEADIHGLYFEGNRFLYKGTRKDTINVFPHISHTVIMEPDSMGTFTISKNIFTEVHALII